tara:strand:- start:115 stop:903 length:789 start_codon:yes stop_codon:yes gene_type:complete
MNVLERFWKTVSSNPLAALGTLGLGAGLVGSFAPETSKYITDWLDMSPEKSLATKDMYGKSTTYGQRNFLGTAATGGYNTKNRSFLGMESGLLYDIRKGIGKTLSTPFKLGEMFNSDGAAYKYLLGEKGSSWTNVKSAFRGALPFETAEVGGTSAIGEVLKAHYLRGGGRGGGGGGSGSGGGTGFKRQGRTPVGYNPGRFQSTKTQGYNPYGMSANLLARAYRDENLGWVNRQARRNATRIGPNIGIKEANISVKNRFTRVR